jgi:uncharacterized protein YfaS (alpha-2-macroglobulin family)
MAARDEGLKITYEITDFDTGELINNERATCDVSLQSGKLYKARVYVQTDRTREYVAVRAPIPSGAEILDSTLVTSASAGKMEYSQSWRSPVSHKNVTDNELQFFWDQMQSGDIILISPSGLQGEEFILLLLFRVNVCMSRKFWAAATDIFL